MMNEYNARNVQSNVVQLGLIVVVHNIEKQIEESLADENGKSLQCFSYAAQNIEYRLISFHSYKMISWTTWLFIMAAMRMYGGHNILAWIFWRALFFSVRLRSSYARYCDRRLSVCLSVCLSVKRVDCDKTKVPSKKSSIMTNSKSPMSFPMSLRWTSYVAPNPPKRAPKAQIWPIICNNFETVRDRM